MKKHVLLSLFLVGALLSGGQVSGPNTIPGDFPTIEAAIAALNSQGAGPGGVIFNVTAGHTETFSYSSAGKILASGSADNPVIFQKSGNGANPLITAAIPGVGSVDYVICVAGADYITFDGIDVQENPQNAEPVSQMEWGYALLKASESNGSQNIIIRNCSISLNPSNASSYGIYSGNHTPTSTTQLVVTDFAGTNSNNKFYGLTVTNAYNAFYLFGRNDNTPYTFYDQDNEIGVDGINYINGLGNTGGSVSSYGIYCSYQNRIKISNTSFTGVCSNATGSLYVISLTSGINSQADVYGNTITMTYLGTGAFYGIYNSGMGASGISNTVNFYNNSIIGNSAPNYTNSTLAYIHITTGGVLANLYGNIISGNTAGSNTATANGTIYYIYFNSSPTIPGTTNIYENIISNNTRIQSSTGNGATYMLYAAGSGNVLNEMDNTIDSITLCTTGSSYAYYNLYSGVIKNFHNNSVTNIFNARSSVYGIYNGNGSGAGFFYGNKIQNINTNAISGKLYGIYQSSGVNQYHYNNFISELKAPFANSNPAIYGIYLAGSTNTGAYNNTVYLDAASNGANFGTTGIYASSSPEVELKNNLVVNNSIPGPAGRIVAYQRSSPVVTTYSSYSNNNNFYAGIPGPSRVIYFDGLNSDQTLSDYKSRVSPSDVNSITENPPFVNVITNPYDLHLMSTVPSQCESGGSTVSYPLELIEDFDGNPRYPNAGYPEIAGIPVNAPDIGADEFAGLLNDLTSPNIIIDALLNTSGTGDRILTTTITDATGVPVSGSGLPVLYWRLGDGNFSAVTATWTSGNTYSFSFGAGASAGDVIAYYIVAQDLVSPVPNVGSSPFTGAGGFSTDPPACEIAPVTPYSYIIVGSLSGTYPVGEGQVYPTLAAAISDLNMKEVVAPVTFELWDTSYSSLETFPLIIHNVAGMSAETPVTIRPKTGLTVTVSGYSATGILALYGADHIIIDGACSDSPERNLIFENNSALANTYVVGLFHDGKTGAKNNTIRNCILKAGSKTNSTWAIILNGQGGDYDNTIIQNNQFLNATTGIQFSGFPIGTTSNGLVTQNIFGSEDNTLTLGNTGINVSNVNGLIISGNTFQNIFTNSNPRGINIGINSLNTTITGNTITGIIFAGTSGSGGKGIDVNTGSLASNLVIANNVISQISGDGWSTFGSNAIVGIRLLGASGGISMYFNTVDLKGSISRPGATSDVSAAFYAAATINNLDIRNNIFSNSLVNTTGIAKAYSIYSDAPAGSFTKINFNNYFGGGPEGILGYLDGERTSLSALQEATIQDEASLDLDPLFVSQTDLHPSNPGIDNTGLYLLTLPEDISGFSRTNPPDMGALEFGINPVAISLAATDVNCETITFNGIINPNGLMVEVYFEYGAGLSYGNSVAGSPAAVTGSEPVQVTATITVPPESTLYFRIIAITSEGVISYGDAMNLTSPAPGQPQATTLDAGSVGSYGATLNGLIAAGCHSTTVTFEYGLTISYGNSVTVDQDTFNGGNVFPVSAIISGLNSNTLYHFRCVANNEAGTTYGGDNEFITLLPAPQGAGTINGPQSVCRASSGHVYSVEPIEFADEYIWTVPPGALITAGENTESITVNFDDAALSGFVNVYGSGEGGNGLPSELFVTVNPLPVPEIAGPAVSCLSSVNTYTTEGGMENYIWAISPGGQILSGDGNNAITVQWNSAGNQSVIVAFTSPSGCQAAVPDTLNVMVSNLPAPSITGSDIVCENQNLYVYTTQDGFSDYFWEVTSGGTIVSGQGTYQVEISWAQAGDQNLSVNYLNAYGCTAPEPATFEVTVLTVPANTGEISGTHELCEGARDEIYSVLPVQGALEYLWALPEGMNIVEGWGTNQIKVVFSREAASGFITVMGVNACGEGQVSPPFELTVKPIPPDPFVTLDEFFALHSSAPEGNQWYHNYEIIEGANGQDYFPEENGYYSTIVTVNECASIQSNEVEVLFTGLPEERQNFFSIYPIPNKGVFNIDISIPDEGEFSVAVFNSIGIKVYDKMDINVKGKAQLSIDLDNPSPGIYTTILQGKGRNAIRKVLVVR
jgi:hypothetical protein